MTYDITTIFCFIDDFCKIYENWERKKLIPTNKKRFRSCEMTLSEMLTIEVCYHLSPCKEFKWYYLAYLPMKHKGCFNKLLSYSRFVELKKRFFVPLSLLLHSLSGERTGIYFIDSTKMEVCHNKRTGSHKVFKGLAKMGMSSYGWFMGFKLHLVINHKGEIMAVKITKANVDDRAVVKELTKGLKGSIYADKGYIAKELFKELWREGLRLITGIRKNMKNYLMELRDKILLRKRSVVESVFHILKDKMNLNHTRHRSPINFCVNALACLVAYCFKKNKPKIKGFEQKVENILIPN